MDTVSDLSIPTTVVSRTEIYEAPTFEEVVAANGEGGYERRSIILKVARFKAVSLEEDRGSMRATCELSELKLQNISNIKYESSEHEFSFCGEFVSHYDHTSYNQTSTRTERTKYRIVVRWGYDLESARAYLILL